MITKEFIEKSLDRMEKRDVGIYEEVNKCDDEFTIDFFTSHGERFQLILNEEMDEEVADEYIESTWAILRESELEGTPLCELIKFQE